MGEFNGEANYPIIYGAPPRKRPFTTYPVALQAIIVNEQSQLLMLNSTRRYPEGAWQVVSGGLDADETLVEGVLREVREEVGTDVSVQPLGVVHAQTFSYDNQIPYMIGIFYLMAYEGGEIVPGDDMVGSEWRWWSVDELENADIRLHVSSDQLWLLRRAVSIYESWQKDAHSVETLQPNLDVRR